MAKDNPEVFSNSQCEALKVEKLANEPLTKKQTRAYKSFFVGKNSGGDCGCGCGEVCFSYRPHWSSEQVKQAHARATTNLLNSLK